MPRPTARVLALLELLQSGGTHPTAELARRLDVDERTLRRYVTHLVELDVPVVSVRGRYGGYRLAPGYRMPPLMLTNEEAVAVLLGLAGEGHAGATAATALAADSAAAKIRRVLPAPLADQLAALLETARFSGPDHRRRPEAPPESDVLLLLARAARDRRPVDLAYRDSAGRLTRRTVHPHGIVAHAGRWYLTGADSLSGEQRTFRLDRITAAGLLPGGFEVPADFDPVASVLGSLAAAPHRYDVSVRVRATEAEVRAVFPESLAIVDPVTEGEDHGAAGWVRVRLRAERLDWVPPLLARLPHDFVIESPGELHNLVRELAARLQRACPAVTEPAVVQLRPAVQHRASGPFKIDSR